MNNTPISRKRKNSVSEIEIDEDDINYKNRNKKPEIDTFLCGCFITTILITILVSGIYTSNLFLKKENTDVAILQIQINMQQEMIELLLNATSNISDSLNNFILQTNTNIQNVNILLANTSTNVSNTIRGLNNNIREIVIDTYNTSEINIITENFLTKTMAESIYPNTSYVQDYVNEALGLDFTHLNETIEQIDSDIVINRANISSNSAAIQNMSNLVNLNFRNINELFSQLGNLNNEIATIDTGITNIDGDIVDINSEITTLNTNANWLMNILSYVNVTTAGIYVWAQGTYYQTGGTLLGIGINITGDLIYYTSPPFSVKTDYTNNNWTQIMPLFPIIWTLGQGYSPEANCQYNYVPCYINSTKQAYNCSVSISVNGLITYCMNPTCTQLLPKNDSVIFNRPVTFSCIPQPLNTNASVINDLTMQITELYISNMTTNTIVSTNTVNIASNTVNIASNTVAIVNNTAAIASLQTTTANNTVLLNSNIAVTVNNTAAIQQINNRNIYYMYPTFCTLGGAGQCSLNTTINIIEKSQVISIYFNTSLTLSYSTNVSILYANNLINSDVPSESCFGNTMGVVNSNIFISFTVGLQSTAPNNPIQIVIFRSDGNPISANVNYIIPPFSISCAL